MLRNHPSLFFTVIYKSLLTTLQNIACKFHTTYHSITRQQHYTIDTPLSQHTNCASQVDGSKVALSSEMPLYYFPYVPVSYGQEVVFIAPEPHVIQQPVGANRLWSVPAHTKLFGCVAMWQLAILSKYVFRHTAHALHDTLGSCQEPDAGDHGTVRRQARVTLGLVFQPDVELGVRQIPRQIAHEGVSRSDLRDADPKLRRKDALLLQGLYSCEDKTALRKA